MSISIFNGGRDNITFDDIEKNQPEIIRDCDKILEHCFYIKKDYHQCELLLEKSFSHFLKMRNEKVKHQCNRSDICRCVYLGTMLVDISLNINSNFLQKLENYFVYPNIHLPYRLLYHICKALQKVLDFQNCRIYIESYLLYSSVLGDKKRTRKTLYQINQDQYEQLSDMLIFDVILMTGGFIRAHIKIDSGIQDEQLRKKFNEKLALLENEYNTNTNTNSNSNAQSSQVNIQDNLNKSLENHSGNFSFGEKIFSKYIVKNSFIQKLYSTFLNKKILISAVGIFLVFLISKHFKKIRSHPILVMRIAKIIDYLKSIKLFNQLFALISGIAKLLVEN